MPLSPKYDLRSRMTAPTMYNSLRPLLADVIASQAVWFYTLLVRPLCVPLPARREYKC